MNSNRSCERYVGRIKTILKSISLITASYDSELVVAEALAQYYVSKITNIRKSLIPKKTRTKMINKRQIGSCLDKLNKLNKINYEDLKTVLKSINKKTSNINIDKI